MREGLLRVSGESPQTTAMPDHSQVSRRDLVKGAVAALFTIASQSNAQEVTDEERRQEILQAMSVMPNISIADFKRGVQIGPHIILMSEDNKQLMVNGRVWSLKMKKYNLSFKDLRWDKLEGVDGLGLPIERGELSIEVAVQVNKWLTLTKKKKHKEESTAKLILDLCEGEDFVELTDENNEPTGAMLKLEQPEEEK
jgi:hypothetical protein